MKRGDTGFLSLAGNCQKPFFRYRQVFKRGVFNEIFGAFGQFVHPKRLISKRRLIVKTVVESQTGRCRDRQGFLGFFGRIVRGGLGGVGGI